MDNLKNLKELISHPARRESALQVAIHPIQSYISESEVTAKKLKVDCWEPLGKCDTTHLRCCLVLSSLEFVRCGAIKKLVA